MRTGGPRGGHARETACRRVCPHPRPVLSSAAVTRTQLLVLSLALLGAVLVGWIVRSGLWRRHRIAMVGAAVLLGLLALTRRLGWAEVAVVAGVIVLAAILVPARR